MLRALRGGAEGPGPALRAAALGAGESKREELSQADLSALGSYVGGLHDHAERYSPPEPSALPRWDWGWPFGEAAPLWGEGERIYSVEEMAAFEAAARRVRGDLRELGYGSDAFGPIHRDLHLGNVVFDGGRAGAIDFDKSGLGHYLLDLSVLLNVLRIHHSARFSEMREALLKGYERERSLPAGYQRHLMTFHAMRHVARANRELRAMGLQDNRHRARGDPPAAHPGDMAAQTPPKGLTARTNATPSTEPPGEAFSKYSGRSLAPKVRSYGTVPRPIQPEAIATSRSPYRGARRACGCGARRRFLAASWCLSS